MNVPTTTATTWPEDCGGADPQGICGCERFCRKHGGSGRVGRLSFEQLREEPRRPEWVERRMRENGPRTEPARPPVEPVADGEKTCRRCETVKPLDEFGRNRGNPDGRSIYCLTCRRTMRRERRRS